MDYVTPSQAAELLGISTASIYRRCREGTLPYTPVGRLIRISLSVIESERLKLSTRQHADWFSAAAVGHRLQISTRTVRRKCAKLATRGIPGIEQSPRGWRIHINAIGYFLTA